MIYFIADTHFHSNDIAKQRGFKNYKEMDKIIIENWNNTVTSQDTVYILGDMFEDCVRADYLSQLKGYKILIVGNHDYISDDDKDNLELIDYPIIFNEFWILSHKPMYVTESAPYANIFGHVHNNPMYKTVSSRSYCVSAERINYTPISFEEIKRQVMAENKA